MVKRTSIKRVNQLLNSKQISCKELTKLYLEKIKKDDKVLNSYITVTEDIAISGAMEVDKKIANGEELSLLEGVPMTIKDNIMTKGIKTTMASKMLKDFIPCYDATVYKILKENNAVLLGKTNMDEFALGSSCRTSYFGGSLNPYNTECVAGGSSGGVAAAVGGNLAVYGLGSDTGGSIREPASFCGIVGLKPTYGAFSRYGLMSYSSSLDQIGPLTVNVEDAAILFDKLAVKDEKDPTSRGLLHSRTVDSLYKSIKGRRIGVIKEYFNSADIEVHKSIQNAIDVYKSLGAKIVYLNFPMVKYSLPIYHIISCAEGASNFARFDGIRYGYRSNNEYKDIEEMICQNRGESLGLEVKRRILFGTHMLSPENLKKYYKKACLIRSKLIKLFDDVFKKCDVIVSPTATKTAFNVNYKYDDPVQGYFSDICTVPVNIIGACAVSVPSGFSSNNLPIGLQIMGKQFCEADVLNFAYQFEINANYEQYVIPEWGVSL